MKYVNSFLNYRCAPDVLGIVGPIRNISKEISEAYSIIRLVKSIALKDQMKYTLVDLCSGNALVPLMAVFSLPIIKSIAIDKRVRNRPWHKAERFEYWFKNIYEDKLIQEISSIDEPVILTSSHPCGRLASQVIKIFKTCENVKYMYLVPCCNGRQIIKLPSLIEEKLNSYEKWCLSLHEDLKEYKINIQKDNHMVTPKNIIITAEK